MAKKLPELVWTPREVEMTALNPYSKNPRKITASQLERLKRSIRENGYHAPIIVNADMTIAGGHQRFKALEALGFTKINVMVPSRQLTEEEFKQVNIRDNLDVGEFDLSALNEHFGLDLLVDLGLPDNLLDGLREQNAHTNVPSGDPDVAPLPPAEPTSKKGDVYELGLHRVMCGDSTSGEQMMRLVGGAHVDLLLTDPPYNVSYTGKTKDALTIKNDEMDDKAFRSFLQRAFAAADAVMKKGAGFYIWHADSEGFNFRGAAKDAGWQVRQCLIWVKNTMVMGRQDYQWKHEPCLYGWKDGASHTWASDRKQTTLLNFDRPTRNAEHPTMKPVALMDYQIQNSTHPGGMVLDSFGGSGSTMVAAHQSGRVARIMELDPAYVDVIVRRMLTLFPALREGAKRNGEAFEAPAEWNVN